MGSHAAPAPRGFATLVGIAVLLSVLLTPAHGQTAFVGSSCPGPAVLPASSYSTVALNAGGAFPASTSCSLVLHATAGHVVQLSMEDLMTSYQQTLYVFDGTTPSAPLLAWYSGEFNASAPDDDPPLYM